MSTPLSTPPSEELLDAALRHELRWEAPPELTNRLLQLVPGAVSVAVAENPPIPRWRLYLALALMTVCVLASMFGLSYLYQIVWFQLGAAQFVAQLEVLPARLIQTLYETIPFARELTSLIALIRTQLHWLLLALVLWVILDNSQAEFQVRRS